MGLSNVERYRALNSKKEKRDTSLSSNVQRYKEYGLQKDLENANKAISETYSGWQNADTMASNKTVLTNAQKNLSDYYNLNQKNFTPEQRTAYNSALSNYDSALKSWDETAEIYSHYVNAEGFDKAKKTYELGQKYKGASYEDIQKALASATDTDEISFLRNYTDYSTPEDFDKAIAEREASRQRTQEGRKGRVVDVNAEKLKSAKDIYEKTHAFDEYRYLQNQADYDRLSKDSEALRIYETGTATDPIRSIARGNVAYSESLSDEQRDMATYIYNTQGEEAYLDYMKKMTYVARSNEAAEMQREASDFAKEHPAAASFMYPTFDTLMGGIAGIESLVSIANGETAPTTMQNLVSANSQALGEMSEGIKENYGKPLGFAYDVFTTAIPNRLGQMLFGSGYNVVMGLQSFSNTYADEVNNGTPAGTALLNALVTGGIETLTEQIGMEWAFGESKGAIETVLKQAFAEGSEEVVGSLANLIYDINVNGGEAEYYQNVNKYIEMGYDTKEARHMASLDFAKEVAHQFGVAAFSTVPTTGVQQISRVRNESRMGEYIDREKIKEIGSEELSKKYGEEWSQKASNREVYNAYDKYVTETKTKATETEKGESVKALMSEYNLSEEEATKYVEALYDGKNTKILNTHFGSVIKEEADNGTGWASKINTAESSKYVDKLSSAADMVMSEEQVKANKAQKKLKVAEKNTVNGEEAEIISMKATKDGYVVKTSKGEVDSENVTVTEDKAKALSYSAEIANEDLKEAYVHYYAGEDIYDYDQYVRTAYEAGVESLDLSEFPTIIDGLGKAKAMAFYNLGAEKTLREEIATEEALDKVIKTYKSKFSTGKFTSGAFVDGKFKEDKDIFRNLNRTQKKLYKVVEAFSNLSGINVRVFVDRSAASKNGEFVADSKGGWISINLAARPYGDSAYGINKYVVSTLSHELTHWMKANNREAYDILENAIVESLTEKGTLEKHIQTEQDSYKKSEGKELSREVALEEVVARACEDMLNSTETMSEVLSHTDMNGLEKLKAAFEEWFKHIKEFFNELMSGFTSPNEITQSLSKEYEDIRKLWVKGINDAINMKRSGQQTSKRVVSSKDNMLSVKLTSDGIEEFVLSAKTKNMTFAQRQQEVLRLIKSDYEGRTAKFWRNGHAYYAEFMPSGYNKNFYGDNKSVRSGFKAKVAIAANGELFELAESARYTKSMPEKVGKTGKAHKNSKSWDYFVKTIKFENKYFDVLINVQNVGKDNYVYNIEMRKAPTLHEQLSSSNRKVGASDKIVTYDGYVVNKPITRNSVKLSERETKALDTLNVEVEGSYAYPKFNLKTFRESDYNKNIDIAAAALAKRMEISVEEAKKYIKDVGSIANIISKDRERLDYEAIEGKSAWVSNPEYGGLLDYSFLCPKRLTYTGTMNAILKKQNDLIFSVDDFLWLRKALITAGYEAPCSFCFVESARARFGKYNQQFLDIAKAEKLAYIPTAEELTNPDKLEELRENHWETYSRYEKFLNGLSQRKPKMLEERRAYNGDILKAFQGKEDTIKDKNMHGGIRFNSFSDFEIVHMLDCMQAIMDMSRVGLAGFGYTKQKAFAQIFGKTGLKINMSCVAKGIEADGKHIIFDDVEGMNHEDALKLRSGNVGIVCVVFNDAQLKAALCDERIDYVLPFHRSQWSKKDYEKMGLSLDTKDYTKPQTEKLGTKKAKEGNIPFLSYWNENQTGVETVQRYLDIINEQGKTPIFPMVLEKVDGKWTMPKGIKKNGKFINKTEEIKEKAAENYWKLLTEFKLYDNDGTPIGQNAVKPNFDMKAARALLKSYEGSHKEFPVAQNVVDDFLEYKKTGETKNFEWKRNSNKMDSKGKELTEDQEKFFSESKIRDDEGHLKQMHHGTPRGGFTIFDPKKSDDKISLFFSDDPTTSASYSGKNKEYYPYMPTEKITDAEAAKAFLEKYGIAKDIDFYEDKAYGRINRYWNATDVIEGGRYRGLTNKQFIEWAESERTSKTGLYKVYLNIKNPYIIDAKGHNWNDIFMPEESDDTGLMESANRLVRLIKENIDYNFGIDEITENLGNVVESIEYGIEEFEIEDDAEEMRRLAAEIDEIYNNWNEEEHPDENGDPTPIRAYILYSDVRPRTTRYIAKWAYEHGYDGVYIKNVLDVGRYYKKGVNYKPANSAIAFSSEQVKSIYNEHPTEDKDIRYSNKVDSQGSSLTEEQVKYFEKSKVRDDQNRLLKMYHGVGKGGTFNVFDRNKSDDKLSFFFTDNKKVASTYQGGLVGALNALLNEAVYDVPDSFKLENGKLVYSRDDIQESNKVYFATEDEAIAFLADQIGEEVEYIQEDIKWMRKEKPVSEIKEVYLNVVNPLVIDAKGGYWNELSIDQEEIGNTRDIAQMAFRRGHDGVIIKNVIDNASMDTIPSTVVIAFNSNQIKNVTNKKPTESEDIRHSSKIDSKGNGLSEKQIEYFKNSKVRDKDGKLLVMYHGTNEEFNTFKPNEFIKEINGTSKIVGYFSEDRNYAEIYGDVGEYYLNITNPLVMSGEAMTVEEWKKFFEKNGVKGIIFDSSITGKKGQKDPLKGGTFDGVTYYTFYELLDMSNYWYGDGNLTEMIQKAGYDGIQSNDEDEKAWMPFNANAVKRIDNLNPTSNEDIRKSEKMSYDELSEPAKERIRELEEEVGRLSDENAALRAEKNMEKINAEKKIMVDRITEQAKVLSRWLLTNDKQNPVPQSVRIPLGKFLTSIDFTKDSYEWRKSHGLLTKSDETLGTRMSKISQMLLELDQDKSTDKDAYDMSQLDWIPEFSTEFAKIKDTIAEVESKEGERFHLGKMNHDDLQTLLNLITALKTSIINMNKCLSAHNKMTIEGVGKEVISYLDRIGQKDKDGFIKQLLEISNTTPYYFFQRLGAGGEQTFKLLMDGMNKYAFEAKQIEDYAKETFKGEDVKKWRDEVKTFEVEEYEVKTDKKEGEMPLERKLRTIQMTVPQIMSLYCLQKRDQAMNHIKTGGIRVGTFETREDGKKVKVRQIENVTLTEKDLKNILSTLTDEQKDVADKLQKFMNTVCQKWGNEVTMKRFGYKGMTEKDYFPINVDRNQLSSEARQKGSSLYQMLNMGFTKPINPNAKNPIEIFDIFETFTIHATEMAQYNSLALPVLDVIKIWNYRDQELLDEEENKAHWHSVKGSIESALGEKANGYIGRLLADLNGDVTGGRADRIGKKFVKNYKTAAVAANLQVAMLQPISYIRAGYMVDNKYLTKGLAMKSDREKCLQYCGIAQWKEMGFYNTAINTGLEHKIMQDDSKKDKAIEKTLFLASKMDEWTWGKLWNACLLETQDNYPTLEGEDLYKKTGERLTEVIYGTQVVDSILTRSDLMRGADMYTNMITAFQSEPTLSLNILMDAAVRFDQEKRASGTQAALRVHGDKIKRAAMVYLTSAAVESLLRAVIGKIRNYDGDEDDETLIEDFFKRFLEELNPLRKIPFARDIWSLLWDVVRVIRGEQYRLYTDTRMDEASFEAIGNALIQISKVYIKKKADYKSINAIAKGFDASGLPVSSTFRILKVLWNNTIGRIWESLNIK